MTCVMNGQSALEERDASIANLRSLLDRRNQELMVWNSQRSPPKKSGPDFSSIPLRCRCPWSHFDGIWRNPEQLRLQPGCLKKLAGSN